MQLTSSQAKKSARNSWVFYIERMLKTTHLKHDNTHTQITAGGYLTGWSPRKTIRASGSIIVIDINFVGVIKLCNDYDIQKLKTSINNAP